MTSTRSTMRTITLLVLAVFVLPGLACNRDGQQQIAFLCPIPYSSRDAGKSRQKRCFKSILKKDRQIESLFS